MSDRPSWSSRSRRYSGDLLLGVPGRAQHRRLAETGVDVPRMRVQDVVVGAIRFERESECEQRLPDAHLRGRELGLQLGGLPVEPKGERRDPPGLPSFRPSDHLVKLSGRREESGPVAVRSGAGRFSELLAESEPLREFREARSLNDRPTPPKNLGPEGQGESVRGEDHDLRRGIRDLMEQPLDVAQRELRRIVDERIEEPVGGLQEDRLVPRSDRRHVLPHRFHEPTDEVGEPRMGHRRSKSAR